LCADYEELAAMDQVNNELAELAALEMMEDSEDEQQRAANDGRRLLLFALTRGRRQ
jgi:hypothetical protein